MHTLLYHPFYNLLQPFFILLDSLFPEEQKMRKSKSKVSGYMRIPRSIATSKKLNHTDKIIWTIIADKVDISEHFNDNRHVNLSITQIAADQGISRSTAKKSIDRLCCLGLMERQQTEAGYEDTYTVPAEDVIDAIMSATEGLSDSDFDYACKLHNQKYQK